MVIPTCLSCHFVLAAAIQRGKEGLGGREKGERGRGTRSVHLVVQERDGASVATGMAKAKMLKL